MRVLVNGLSMLGAKAGIGHYAAEVVRCLRAKLGESQVVVHQPAPSARTGFARVREWLEQPSRLGQPILWRQWTLGGLLWLKGLARAGVDAVTPKKDWSEYDLYHEPNFLPLPIDLPTVVTVHDLSVLEHPEWHPAARLAEYEKRFASGLERARHLVTVSEHARQEIVRLLGADPSRVTVTYNGVRELFRPLPAEAVRERLKTLGLPTRYLLHVGTIEPRKNLLMLMKAYCTLPASVRASCPLVLAGGWGWRCEAERSYLQGTARHKGVIHAGYLAEEDLGALYNGARALVFPTHYEGFGMPAAEMLACGGAVLASTAGAVAEVLGGKGHLTEPQDESGWREAMQRVIEDDEWRESLCVGGVERAATYTWDRCAEETLAGYAKALRPVMRRAA